MQETRFERWIGWLAELTWGQCLALGICALVVGCTVVAFWRRCESCGRWRATEVTGEHRLGGREVTCRACGHKTRRWSF